MISFLFPCYARLQVSWEGLNFFLEFSTRHHFSFIVKQPSLRMVSSYGLLALFYHHVCMCGNFIVAWMAAVLLYCLCAVLSKEQGITVVGVCLVYEFFLLHKVGKIQHVVGNDHQ